MNLNTFIKKIFFIVIFCFFISALAHAFNCPSVEDIQQNHFLSWVPLYKEGEELAMDGDVKRFQRAVKNFAKAHWNKDYLESGHCFYQGDDLIVEKIIFAHDAWRPEQSSHWHWIHPNAIAECVSSSVEACGFVI